MKKLRQLLISAALLGASFGTVGAQQGFVHGQSDTYVWPEEANVLQKLDQWQDLKFGVLLHWGLYSVPGIVESWSICSEDQDWIPRDSTMEYNAYKQWYWGLKDSLNPTQFDPEQWASVFQNAGMKYAIFTTKHHDGFNMFDTKQTDFSIANGPFGSDPRADVAAHVFEAFRNRNFMTGAYFSKPDWHCEYYWWPRYATATRNVNYKIANHPEQWKKFQDFTYRQIEELMTGYGDLDILWLDGGWVAAPRQDIKMDSIAAMARVNQPGILIVDRTIQGKFENYQTPERSIPATQLPNPWESCITLSHDWGWVPNAPYKSPEEVIALLSEIVAKGGCFLLGVGPTPEGIIEQPVVDRLEKVGKWLSKNGKAIYNTRNAETYSGDGVWFTADKDGKTVYAIVPKPKDGVYPEYIEWTGNVPVKGSSVKWLETGRKLKWENQGETVRVYLPASTDTEAIALSFRIKK